MTADVHADDQVTFGISFQTSDDPWTDPTKIIEDQGRCSVKMDSEDDRFWTTTVADYSWVCANVSCNLTSLATATWYTGEFTESQDTVNDWVVGIVDDDPRDRFCTGMQPVKVVNPNAPTYAEYQALEKEAYYECSKLKCVHQRKMVTDDSKDFAFSTTAATKLILNMNRSFVLIQNSALSTGATLPMFDTLTAKVELEIGASAFHLSTILGSALILAAII